MNSVALELVAARGLPEEPREVFMTGIPLSLLDSVLGLLVKLMTLVSQYARLKDEK